MDAAIALTYIVEPEDDQFVATCKELDVSSFGTSVEDATEHLHNAVLLYLDVLQEDNELEQVFKERGIEVVRRLHANYAVSIHPGVFATVRQVPVRAS
jgi:predicted RNase H-like HicB family nuclease